MRKCLSAMKSIDSLRWSGFRFSPWIMLLILSSISVSSAALNRVAEWQSMMETYRSAPVAEQLEAVNRHLNQIPYVADSKHWGREDYWATPFELLTSGGGDCEDFALTKYFTQIGDSNRQNTIVRKYPRATTARVLNGCG